MRSIFVLLLIAMSGVWANGQVTATKPASAIVVQPAADYASVVFQDPWDMNQRTDIGSYTQGVDQPYANLTGITFANGVFSATTATRGNFWLLDPSNPYAVNMGKQGGFYPIETTKYQRLLMRMKLTGGAMAATPATPAQTMQIIWTSGGLVGTVSTANSLSVYPGWWVYSIDLPTLGVAVGNAWASGNVDGLRINPVSLPGVSLELDWARLVQESAANKQEVAWTGSGSVDVYLDMDTSSANGFHAQIGKSVAASPFSFAAGGLAQGEYRVAVCPAGTTSGCSYAPGSWDVRMLPLMEFTAPSPEGSSDEFAAVQLNNAWDMSSLADMDLIQNTTAPAITTIAAENPAGQSLGNVRVLKGTSFASPAGGWGDPNLYALWVAGRGADYRIDTNRYRIMTVEMGVEGARDINAGSIARIVWRNVGETPENVSDDIVLYHRAGVNVIEKIIADLKTLPGDPLHQGSTTGWTGLVENFRVDPHEFPDARPFWVKSIKIAALEKAANSYTIAWNYTGAAPNTVTLALYRDSDATGFNGTLIATGLDPSTGSYTWNTSAVAAGTYYIYGVLSVGGTAVNQTYARWPIIVDPAHTVLPTISLNRPKLIIGATKNGSTTTSPQEVNVQVNGQGTVTWTVTSNRTWLVPTPASGTGSGKFSLALVSNALPSPGDMDGTITVTATGAANSPQYVKVDVKVINTGATAKPFGSFDTPVDGTTGVAGAIAVTGWALDDVGIERVMIFRDPVGAEPAQSNGLVYIADGMFVPDARPDLVSAFPTMPANYKGGWGYMMLTNFLPVVSGPIGNGTYKLHAYAQDKEGGLTLLGSKTITVDNKNAAKPFGTIDTPGQGATISGKAYVNFGWALTPQPSKILEDGSTIGVAIDGVFLPGPTTYNQYRSDIATVFPGYANSGGAVGFRYLDTTAYANGMHTIGWLVRDMANRADGVGSRFFFVLNSGASSVAAEPASSGDLERAKRRMMTELRRRGGPILDSPAYRTGWSLDSPLMMVRQGGEGLLEPVEVPELGRVELHLPEPIAGAEWRGGVRIGGDLSSLPVGSTFDAEAGVLYWQLGAGFLGEFQFEFTRERSDKGVETVVIPVRVGQTR